MSTSTPPPASQPQPAFSSSVFEAQQQQALLGNDEPARVRARVLLAVVVVAAGIAPVVEGLRYYGELKMPSDPPGGPSVWPLLLVAIAVGVGHLDRARGGHSPRGLIAVALAVAAAVDLCAVSALFEDHELFPATLPQVPSLLVSFFGVPVAVVWTLVAAVVGWKANERGPGPMAVAGGSIALIVVTVVAVIAQAFAWDGPITRIY